MSGLQGLMEGRVVLVTGAGAGVGRGVSAALGQRVRLLASACVDQKQPRKLRLMSLLQAVHQ